MALVIFFAHFERLTGLLYAGYFNTKPWEPYYLTGARDDIAKYSPHITVHYITQYLKGAKGGVHFLYGRVNTNQPVEGGGE